MGFFPSFLGCIGVNSHYHSHEWKKSITFLYIVIHEIKLSFFPLLFILVIDVLTRHLYNEIAQKCVARVQLPKEGLYIVHGM